jgi:glutamate dehydrogenase/leucine dehydrogenase
MMARPIVFVSGVGFVGSQIASHFFDEEANIVRLLNENNLVLPDFGHPDTKSQ